MNEIDKISDFLFYKSSDDKTHIQVIIRDETVWTTQKGMSDVFGSTRENITMHLKNILESNELQEDSVCKEILHTAADGKKYNTKYYNLDAIIAVGYRINSYQATQFRIWATKILKEYLVKGFALDDERLKQGKTIFGKDYFDELLERIREIRASERRFYLKITDIYAQCSIDYDKNSPITQTFFATVQNKLEFAITHMTASEIIKSRVSALKPHMGLQTWQDSPNGKILKRDISVAKNYLDEKEINELNAIVNMYLDYAELQAKRQRVMNMNDWVERLDAFLKFNEYDILHDAGNVKMSVAKAMAEREYEKFRVIQDREYKSDFDRVVENIKHTHKLPNETSPESKKPKTKPDKQLKNTTVGSPPFKGKSKKEI